MQDTAGEVGTSWKMMYSHGPLHMAVQKQVGQLESTYCSSVRRRIIAQVPTGSDERKGGVVSEG